MTEIHIRTPSRLHFGLLAYGKKQLRNYGGVGLMISDPGIELFARPSEKTQVRGNASQSIRKRAFSLIQRIMEQVPYDGGVELELLRVAPEHVGLGTGTQLSLGIAKVVCRFAGLADEPTELARLTGRGRRSAIGIHGFDRGGFLVDGGKSLEDDIGPLISRFDFPIDWPILLIRSELSSGLYGSLEEKVFSNGLEIPSGTTDRLTRLVLLGMLPALKELDYPAFGEALHEYNLTIGRCFEVAQGGIHANPSLTRIVTSLRDWDVPAVGQSSWGPTLFAILPDPDRAEWTRDRLKKECSILETQLTITAADNKGVRLRIADCGMRKNENSALTARTAKKRNHR